MEENQLYVSQFYLGGGARFIIYYLVYHVYLYYHVSQAFNIKNQNLMSFAKIRPTL